MNVQPTCDTCQSQVVCILQIILSSQTEYVWDLKKKRKKKWYNQTLDFYRTSLEVSHLTSFVKLSITQELSTILEVMQPLDARETCIPWLAGSGSWKLVALVGWNWLKRRYFTKNLPVANQLATVAKVLMFTCKYLLTSLGVVTANGTSPFETWWLNHGGTVRTFKANRLHLWFALQFSVFTEKLKIVT